MAKIPKTIDEMAIDAVLHRTQHPKDFSDHRVAKMRGRFGSKATNEAMIKAQDIARLMGLKLNYPDTFIQEAENDFRIWK